MRIIYSSASEGEMDSPRSVRSQGQQEDDGIDPQIYAMFQKMMKKMMSEQTSTSSDKNPFSQRIRGYAAKKSTKSSKKHVQAREHLRWRIESTENTEEECEIIQEATRKPKGQAVEDPLQDTVKGNDQSSERSASPRQGQESLHQRRLLRWVRRGR